MAADILFADAPGFPLTMRHHAIVSEAFARYRQSHVAAAVAAEWRPIESAPRDGAVLFLTSTSPLWKYPFPAKWDAKQDWWVFADEPLNDIWAVSDLVTHWMPLPAPPEPQP
jgi:hypothetical protein